VLHILALQISKFCWGTGIMTIWKDLCGMMMQNRSTATENRKKYDFLWMAGGSLSFLMTKKCAPGIEPTIFRTLSGHLNHYTTKATSQNSCIWNLVQIVVLQLYYSCSTAVYTMVCTKFSTAAYPLEYYLYIYCIYCTLGYMYYIISIFCLNTSIRHYT
jgi:hypothetical protein